MDVSVLSDTRATLTGRGTGIRCGGNAAGEPYPFTRRAA